MLSSNEQTIYTYKGHIPALDGIRGLAIVMVMVSHFLFRNLFPSDVSYNLLQSGWLGVDLFFVLSGFLITGILSDTRERKDGYWLSFVRRRALRIMPLYYFSVIVTYLTIVFVEKTPDRLNGYDSFAWFFTFTPNIAMALKGNWLSHSNIFSLNHLWSVAIEEQFYLVWPLVVYLLPPRALLMLCAILVHFSSDLRHMTDNLFDQRWSMAAYMMPYCRMDGLATGSFLAVFLRLGWQSFVPYERWVLRILLVWMGYRTLHDVSYGSTHYIGTLSAITFGALLFLALNPHPKAFVRRFCENAFLRHLGKYSYALYVFHDMMKMQWEQWFGQWLFNRGWYPFWQQTTYILLAFGGSYLLARASWVLIEKPFLKLKKQAA
jgi:peptidoglycan/LPS O-acetylase OafA/YrhL